MRLLFKCIFQHVWNKIRAKDIQSPSVKALYYMALQSVQTVPSQVLRYEHQEQP